MTIRVKLALVIAAGMAAAMAASAAIFVSLQRGSLQASTAERERLLLTSVQSAAEEAALSGDELVLVDHLLRLREARPEIRAVRLRIADRWQELGGGAADDPETVTRTIEVKKDGGLGAAVEVHVSRAALAAKEREGFARVVRDIARASLGVLAIGVLAALLLAGTLTRRIVQIEEALGRLGQGRFEGGVPEKGSDEVARLARGVNEMARRLKELDEAKRTFVASVTHELRSPLAAIESQAKRLREASLDERAAAALTRIETNSSRLRHFVTNILEMAKIERGRLDFHPTLADPGALVADTAAFFSAQAEQSGVTMTATVEPGLPRMRLDPDLVIQVVTNLVSNALKFTPRGGKVGVSAARVRRGARDGVQVSVSDSGVGMPAEALGRIFKPFERIANPLRAGGAGLGLAISRTIADMHAGELWAESQQGKGSTFRFFVPFEGPAGAGPSKPPPAGPGNKSVTSRG